MTWWHYLLLVNFYLVVFFGFYVLLLRRETFFQLNRVYLVAASLLSFLIPLIQANWVQNLFITQQVQQTIYSMPVGEVYNFTIRATAADRGITLGQVINALYIAVTLFLIIRLGWQLLVLKKAIEKPSPSAAYSFFKKISLGENISPSSVIAEHEQVHAGQWHSVDVMIIETVMIINWFNPVVYLYRFAIKYIHEFIADRQVIQAGTDKADYAMLLLSQTFQVETHNLATPFYNHSLLKKRIMMLHKNRSQRIALAKYGLSAPLFILMMILSSATINNSKTVAAINKKTQKVLLTPAADVVPMMDNSSEILAENKSVDENYIKIVEDISTEIDTNTIPKQMTEVDKRPSFRGGADALEKYLSENIEYPAAERENKIEGKVFVGFIVEEDGTLSNIEAASGPSTALKAEAVRVMLKSPKWYPGVKDNKLVRTAYAMPIEFRLGEKVFSQVDKQPGFPGGYQAFGQFLASNIKYPTVDKVNKIEGRVIVTFVVEPDGTLSDLKALRSPSETLSAEAIRVMSRSPKWIPGVQNGYLVRVSYTIPIAFKLPAAVSNDGDKVYNMVDKQPSFPGGIEAFGQFISMNIKYPKEDREAGRSGKVICQFIVETDGTLTDVKSLRAPSETMAKEAVRVLMRSPKWTPGFKDNKAVRVSYTVPINYQLGEENGYTLPELDSVMRKNHKTTQPPLYVINGVVQRPGTVTLSKIKQEDIASMEVLKDETGVARYGEAAKNGVIIIVTTSKAKK